MRPRRDVFAAGYIHETVEAYAARVQTATEQPCQDPEVCWAHDVLMYYFAVVSSHTTVDSAAVRFASLPSSARERENHVPYRRDLETSSPVSFEAFCELAHRRRSVRWFLEKRVPRGVFVQRFLRLGWVASIDADTTRYLASALSRLRIGIIEA